MVKQVARDVMGELLETGKQTVKAGKKAAGDVAKQAGKAIIGQQDSTDEVVKSLYGVDEGVERPSGKKQVTAKGGKMKKKIQAEGKPEELVRLEEIDKQKSAQAYKEIQEQIRLLRKKKASQPRKYETGKAGFDEEQVEDPESFFDKMKKKKEEAEKKGKLPWASKKGMGTGEISRGVSG